MLNVGDKVAFVGTVETITGYARQNIHMKSQMMEAQVCIGMKDADGKWYATFTGVDTEFAIWAVRNKQGAAVQLDGKFKREQSNKFGAQTVLTNMRVTV